MISDNNSIKEGRLHTILVYFERWVEFHTGVFIPNSGKIKKRESSELINAYLWGRTYDTNNQHCEVTKYWVGITCSVCHPDFIKRLWKFSMCELMHKFHGRECDEVFYGYFFLDHSFCYLTYWFCLDLQGVLYMYFYTYSGRGKFMPLPLKSKIIETPGFLVTDYIKMFPL